MVHDAQDPDDRLARAIEQCFLIAREMEAAQAARRRPRPAADSHPETLPLPLEAGAPNPR